PFYYTISYTWGDEQDTVYIIINDAEMTVRVNCDYALRQALASEASKYLWIDAICIDQMATQERNHRVAMMGKVYSRAAHVLACVGNHADDS
ncbi:hypothetical protein EK21DRAFT_50533, partial [Setomelanomma holmii]